MTDRTLARTWFFVLLSFWAVADVSAAWPKVSEADMALLPPYCKSKLGGLVGGGGYDKAEYKHWESSVGADHTRIHHYCFGLYYLKQYHREAPGPRRESNLRDAVRNFDYVIDRALPDSTLLPEILTQKANALRLWKRNAEAAKIYAHVVVIRPNFEEGWAAYADFLAELNQRSKALETVIAGLRNVPGSKRLQRRYLSLGGKLPYPEPLVNPEKLPDTPVESSTPSIATPVAADSLPNAANSAADSGTISDPQADGQLSRGDGAASKKSKNPYCRFCPDD